MSLFSRVDNMAKAIHEQDHRSANRLGCSTAKAVHRDEAMQRCVSESAQSWRIRISIQNHDAQSWEIQYVQIMRNAQIYSWEQTINCNSHEQLKKAIM